MDGFRSLSVSIGIVPGWAAAPRWRRAGARPAPAVPCGCRRAGIGLSPSISRFRVSRRSGACPVGSRCRRCCGRSMCTARRGWRRPRWGSRPAGHASRVVLLGVIWRGCAPMGGRIRSSIASNAFAAPSSSPVSIHSSMACRRMLASSPGEGRPGVCVGRPWSCVVVVRSPAAGVPRARTRR